MRLISLKLAGFKSFVDSTTLVFPDNRTAVVGPNGCGKSNVIDAIRWVMGESSARQLRGGAMTDVIFAGTSTRKPVGQASVELRFENTLGKLGGTYNAYTELSVRRQVNRDGKSDYFLNGTRCRRRDITDIFLGTGLGPRSYAIIEQGMINRLVDAKPEEMRVFIEEAAGVSRYQARRRETLQHLEHAQQNLDRLQDVSEELQSQMRVLKRQSQAALRYRELEKELLTLKTQVWSAHYGKAQQEQLQHTTHMTTLGDEYRELRSRRNQAEQDWQNGNTILNELLGKAEPIQQHWQQAEREVLQVQGWLQQYQRDQTQREQQREQWQRGLDEINQQITQDQGQDSNTQKFLAEAELRVQELLQQFQAAEQQYQHLDSERFHAEENYQQSYQQFVSYEQQRNHIQQQIDAAGRARVRLEQHVQQAQAQLERLGEGQQQEELEDLGVEQDELNLDKAKAEQQIGQLQAQQQALQAQMHTVQTGLKQLESALLTDQSELNALEKLLQKPAASQQQGKDKHGKPQHKVAPVAPVVDSQQRLIKQLKLSAAAQPHVGLLEKFLADWLSAVERSDFADAGNQQLARLFHVDLLDAAEWQGLVHQKVTALTDWIESPFLSQWQAVGVVADHATAIGLQPLLAASQSLLTLDGYWLGSNWQLNLNVDEQAARQQGLLQQQLRHAQLLQQVAELKQQVEPVRAEQAELQAKQDQLKQQLKQAEQALAAVLQQQRQLDVQRARLESTLQANQQQKEQLNRQLLELQQTQVDDQEQLAEWQMELASINLRLQQLQPRVQQHKQQLADLQQSTQQAQLDRQTSQQQLHQLQSDVQAKKAQQGAVQQAMQRAYGQREAINQQLRLLDVAYEEAAAAYPAQAEQLLKVQELAGQAHAEWTTWQQQLEQRQREQQQLTEQRQQGQVQEDQLRDTLEQARLRWQDCKNRMEQALEQLTELEVQPVEVDPASLPTYQAELEKVQQQIQRLGDLNLAAPTALDEVNERHQELAHQMQDLQDTIDQLQEAIKNIDQETRTLFMATFDHVNKHLQELFPKVFGGGEASLSLEDDWQSGVKLMARPPGKRNSTLALLSGGEKALTALALVFAIFRLNPAPFCVLDEVDAPLDDANVKRFCHLVKELSQQVQFIYITHNKVAMTMATDLLGVTMPEAGASRLVAVNIEQAAKLGAISE